MNATPGLYGFSFAQAFAQGAQIACGHFDSFVFTRAWIPDALFLNVRAERPAGMTLRVTARIAHHGLLAGFDASTGHM